MRSWKKIIALVLCVTILTGTVGTTRAKAFAGAEGIIGGAALTGVSLSAPQIAALIAAAGGAIYVAENWTDIKITLDNALDAALQAASAVSSSAQQELAEWWELAKKGAIALSSAPAWIYNALREWIAGQYDGTSHPTIEGNLPAGTYCGAFLPANTRIGFGRGSTDWLKANSDTRVLMYYMSPQPLLQVGDSFTLSCMLFAPYAFSYWDAYGSRWKTATSTCVVDGQTYYYGGYSTGTTVSNDTIGVWWGYAERAYWYGTSYTGLKMAELIAGVLSDEIKPTLGSESGSICPDTVGGIGATLESGTGIDSVNFPDMVLDGTGSICPDTGLTGSDAWQNSISATLDKVASGEMTWEDYIADVGIGDVTVSVPNEGEGEGTTDFPVTDEGVGSTPVPKPEIDTNLGSYTLPLTEFFPFCIPFDLVDMLGVLAAPAEAPRFEWVIPTLDGEGYPLVIDLSAFDGVAQIVRNMELLAFCIALALKTRSLIRG